jgi:hypothetical protein
MHTTPFLSMSVHMPEVVSFDPLDRARVLFVSGQRTVPNDPYGAIADVRDGIHTNASELNPGTDAARRFENIRREEETALASLRQNAEAQGPHVLTAFQSDVRGALAARLWMVKGVITGQQELVDKALAAFADPNAIVLAQDPNSTRLVPMPIGLAALLRGHAIAKAEGPEKAAPWMALSRKLLMSASGPRIRLGDDPSNPGSATSAISWNTFGFAASGADSVETRTISGISVALFGAIAKVLPEAIVDGPVPARTEGWVPGERLSDRSSMALNLLAGQEFHVHLTRDLEHYRSRKAGQVVDPVIEPIPTGGRRPGRF